MELTIGKVLAAVLALGSAGCGITAARYSAAAGRVSAIPPWGNDITLQPGEPMATLQGWNAATLSANDKAGKLNGKAAAWSAWSAKFAVLAAIVGVFT